VDGKHKLVKRQRVAELRSLYQRALRGDANMRIQLSAGKVSEIAFNFSR
jgi:hypothetical protein